MNDPNKPEQKHPPQPPGDLEKLIGSWTAGSLPEAERRALLKGAIENQALFDALADEEGLRELLADPAVRAELSEILEEQPAEPAGAGIEAAAYPPQAAVARRMVQSPEPAAPAAPAPPARRREPAAWWRSIFTPVPMAGFGLAAAAVFAFVMLRPAALVEDQGKAARQAPVEMAANKDAPPAAAELDTVGGRRAPAASPVAVPAPPRFERPASAPAISGAVRKTAGGESEARARDEVARDAAPAAGAQPAAPAPPPAPVSPPAPAPKMAVMAEASPVVAVEEKSKRAAAAPPVGATAPLPALRFRIERQQASGEWVEFGGELGRGDRARLAVVAPAEGVLSVAPAGGGVVATLKASAAGETVYYPATGSLPSEAGEREFVLAFSQEPNPARVSNFLVGPQQAVGGRASRARRTTAASEGAPGAADAAAVTGPAVPQLVTATVRLRYR